MDITKRVREQPLSQHQEKGEVCSVSTVPTFNSLAKLTFTIISTYLKRMVVTFAFETFSSFISKDVTSCADNPCIL